MARSGAKRGPAQGRGSGPAGNERLTLLAGYLLLLGYLLLGVTVLRIRALLELHLLLGIALLGPLAVKVGAVGWRFASYYLRRPPYLRKGPPPFLLRALGPVFVLDTLFVFASGLVLLAEGPAAEHPWLFLHKASFILWLGLFGIHLLGHSRQLLLGVGEALAERERLVALLPAAERPPRAGRFGRAMALVAGVAAGALAAAAVSPSFPLPHRHERGGQPRGVARLSSNRRAIDN